LLQWKNGFQCEGNFSLHAKVPLSYKLTLGVLKKITAHVGDLTTSKDRTISADGAMEKLERFRDVRNIHYQIKSLHPTAEEKMEQGFQAS